MTNPHVVVDDTDPNITYTGNWQPINESNKEIVKPIPIFGPTGGQVLNKLLNQANNKTISLCLPPDCTIKYNFTGSYVSIHGIKGPGMGSISVTIDDQQPVKVSLENQQFSVGHIQNWTLLPGDVVHTLYMTNSNDIIPPGGSKLNLDAFHLDSQADSTASDNNQTSSDSSSSSSSITSSSTSINSLTSSELTSYPLSEGPSSSSVTTESFTQSSSNIFPSSVDSKPEMSSSTSSGKSHTGIIVGSVIGGLAFLILFFTLAFFLWRKYRTRRQIYTFEAFPTYEDATPAVSQRTSKATLLRPDIKPLDMDAIRNAALPAYLNDNWSASTRTTHTHRDDDVNDSSEDEGTQPYLPKAL